MPIKRKDRQAMTAKIALTKEWTMGALGGKGAHLNSAGFGG